MFSSDFPVPSSFPCFSAPDTSTSPSSSLSSCSRLCLYITLVLYSIFGFFGTFVFIEKLIGPFDTSGEFFLFSKTDSANHNVTPLNQKYRKKALLQPHPKQQYRKMLNWGKKTKFSKVPKTPALRQKSKADNRHKKTKSLVFLAFFFFFRQQSPFLKSTT